MIINIEGLSLSHVYIGLLAMAISVVLVLLAGKPSVKPTKFQALWEGYIRFVRGMVIENMGHEGLRYVPLISAIGLFVFFSNLLGGGTNLEKAILQGSEELELFCKKNHLRGVLIAFSDGEPTRGLKGEALRSLVREVKGKFPVVGVGVGKEKNYIEEYFEGTGIRVSEVSQLGQVFLRVVENYLKRAWSEV